VKQKQRRTVTEVGVVVVSRRRGCHVRGRSFGFC